MIYKLPRNKYRISITSGCNMKCIYCHNEGNNVCSKLTIEQIENIIQQSYDLGLEEIRLTGGDPLTHPDIIEICEMINNYGLKTSINTNCILIDKLLYLVKRNLINRIVVGLDYYDGKISKNSPIGVPSQKILNNIMELKKHGCDVSISTVFSNNFDDIDKLVGWCISNNVRIKIIEEEKNEIFDSSDDNYLKLQEYIIKKYNLNKQIDELNEVNGYINGFRVVSFFYSFCRLRRCDLCRNIQLRITSNGIAKNCLYYSNNDVDLFNGKDINLNLKKFLSNPIDYYYDEKIIVKKLTKGKKYEKRNIGINS